MKWQNALLCSLLLSVTGVAISNNEVKTEDSPASYATGMMLETQGSSPWYRVSLPQVVYQTTAWPDLRDIRVFNAQGETVPFSLTVQKNQPVTPPTVSLRLFPLDMSPLSPQEKKQHSRDTFVLRSKENVTIYLPGDDLQGTDFQSYLLTLPEEMKTPFSLAQLQLNWAPLADNWQGKASVYASRDLRYWRAVQKEAPLMDLTRDNDHLKMNVITTSLNLSPEDYRYLLVVVNSKSPAFTLKGVDAMAESSKPESRRIAIDAEANKISDNEVIWRWKQPQPLASLRIVLENDHVLPIELAWKSEEKANWQPLAKTVLYHLDGKHSPDIPLYGEWVAAVRMTTINAKLPEVLPVLSGERNSYQLVFNTQGKGPYMLAWGNRAAQKADVELNQLIPSSLHQSQDVDNLPWAKPQEKVSLGGEARLTAISAAEQQHQWQTWLVWIVLISGVIGLALIVWRIWCEVKKNGTL
ncbi:DUF3999 domain-containing protein [Enterobacteriaceae bacterium ESL0689]|nr:DUF3999 domain-containing protein [Enterobacteriaceae bacterium ESL0689]